MMSMNRRSFLKYVGKTVGGVLGLGAVGLPKLKETQEAVKQEVNWYKILTETPIFKYPELSCIWRDRKFLFAGKRIRWSEVGEHDNFAEHSYIDLPTYEICKNFLQLDGCLFWLGDHCEIWEIEYIGGELEFQFKCLSKDSREGMIWFGDVVWGRWEGVRFIETA